MKEAFEKLKGIDGEKHVCSNLFLKLGTLIQLGIL